MDESRISMAVRELQELQILLVDLPDMEPDEMQSTLEHEFPGFMDRIDALDDPPDTTVDLWTWFSIWSLGSIRSKYEDIWAEVIRACERDVAWREEVRKNILEQDASAE